MLHRSTIHSNFYFKSAKYYCDRHLQKHLPTFLREVWTVFSGVMDRGGFILIYYWLHGTPK